MINEILSEKRLILSKSDEVLPLEIASSINAYLFTNFGIIISNNEMVNFEVLGIINNLFHLHVPSSFYDNPQDTQYFDSDELLVEQIVSYLVGYGTDLKRIELFAKKLPSYKEGDEKKIRVYRIIKQDEADPLLREYASMLASYTRPFAEYEKERFIYLAEHKYFSGEEKICCKDNIFPIIHLFPKYAKELDKKDVVKLSISYFGENEDVYDVAKSKYNAHLVLALSYIIPLVKDCPLSKRQAKYFLKVCQIAGLKDIKASNENSPYKKAIKLIKEGKVIEAAKVFDANGSLLLRNFKFLFSRASKEEEEILLNMLPKDNQIVILQILLNIVDDTYGVPRFFSFKRRNAEITHLEDEYETKYRKSALSEEKKNRVINKLKELLKEHYSYSKKLGKVYISDDFNNVALPLSTTSTGNGIDVLPSGSRIPFKAKYLRVFCYWKGIQDIDASLGLIKDDEIKTLSYSLEDRVLSWRTYHRNPFVGYALCSGDDTSNEGAEYQDIDIDGLTLLGYRYAVFGINGYYQPFDQGSIKCGIQIKTNLATKAWQADNIEFEMDIKGNARGFTPFVVDLLKKEIIIINIKVPGSQIFSTEQINITRKYLSEDYLSINMKTIISYLGEVVDTPLEADYVFDKDYTKELSKQVVVKPFDVASLIEIINR